MINRKVTKRPLEKAGKPSSRNKLYSTELESQTSSLESSKSSTAVGPRISPFQADRTMNDTLAKQLVTSVADEESPIAEFILEPEAESDSSSSESSSSEFLPQEVYEDSPRAQKQPTRRRVSKARSKIKQSEQTQKRANTSRRDPDRRKHQNQKSQGSYRNKMKDIFMLVGCLVS